MVFSDTSGKLGLIQDIEDRLGFSDGYISGSTDLLNRFTRRINHRQNMAHSIILDANPDVDFDDHNYGDRPAGTFPLTSDRAFEIPVTERIVKYKRVDVTYDGTTWYRADRVDSSSFDFGLGDDTKEDSHFSITNPKYDLEGNAVILYPKPSNAQVLAGAKIRLEWVREMEEFSATGADSKESGIDEVFHPYLSVGAAYDWLVANRSNENSLINVYKNEIDRFESLIQTQYSNKNLDGPLTFIPGPSLSDYS